jgi:Icc-related predicted phosphoesterase
LITHTPPFAILDHGLPSDRREGCPYLFEAVFRARPRIDVFGHIHAGCGILRTSDALFMNASHIGEDGSLSRRLIVIDLEARR